MKVLISLHPCQCLLFSLRKKCNFIEIQFTYHIIHPLKAYNWSEKIELLYDSAILLLPFYLKKTKTLIWKDICTSQLIAAPFTIARIWKQSKCPSTNEWIKEMWWISTMNYYSTIKREWNLFPATWMDLEFILLSERSQTEKDKWFHLCVKCKTQNKWTNKTKQNLPLQRTFGGCQRGGRVVGGWKSKENQEV